MPKKKHKEAPEEQSARFRAEVERMIEAGELNPTEAEEAMDRLVRRSRPHPQGASAEHAEKDSQ